MKKVYLILILTTFVLCTGPVSSWAQTNDIQVDQTETGQVVFYRIKKAKGGAIKLNIVDISKVSVGTLKNGSVIRKNLEPGRYTFSVRTPSLEGSDSITLDVEAGKVYYVKGEVLLGWPAGRPKFSQISESEAQSDLRKIE